LYELELLKKDKKIIPVLQNVKVIHPEETLQ
jgi:hypothetical protein